MQAHGVSAGIVQTGKDLAQDPHLDDRKFFVEVDNPGIGAFSYTGMAARLSETPYEIKRSPRLGEHNEYVYTKLLGIPDEEFVYLYSEGVFECNPNHLLCYLYCLCLSTKGGTR